MKKKAVSPWLGALHLAVLAAFAVAQPLYDILGRHPAFLVAQRMEGWSLVGFTLVLSLGIPGILVALWALLRLMGRPVGAIGFWTLSAGLSALFFWPLLRGLAGKSLWILPLGIVLSVLFSEAYRRSGAIRSVLTLLIPVVLLFPVLFLSQSDVSGLAFGSSLASPRAGQGGAQAPVVVVVLDELPTTTLLDSQGQIDPLRFPHLAALADQSHWFRRATTVSASTILAVPAILDGRFPKERNTGLPTLHDHPENLFTLLAPTHRLLVSEVLTRLAPEWAEQIGAGNTSRFARDTALVYLHVALPPQAVSLLPPLGAAWTDFGKVAAKVQWSDFRRPRRDDRVEQFESFIRAISAQDPPSLYFLHVLLPHSPWVYLPDGRLFVTADASDVRGALGVNDQGLPPTTWMDDAWVVTQAQQRHILQAAYVDGLLGRLVDHLKAEGLFDRSLLALVADHGVSFRPGDQRRDFTETNLQDLMPVPMMIKLPYQRRGKVHSGMAAVIDLVPTIADGLGLDPPSGIDGRPLLAEPEADPTPSPTEGGRRIMNSSRKVVRIEEAPLWAGVAESLQAKLATFGEGDWSILYRVGPFPELLGRSTADLSVDASSALRVEFENRFLYSTVDPTSPLLPTQIAGRLDGGQGIRSLAVAVNGVVEGVTWSSRINLYEDFTVVIPPSALREGVNRIEVFEVRKRSDRLRLTPIRSDTECRDRLVVDSAGRLTIRGDDGHEYAVREEGLTGWVHASLKDGMVTLGGWCADLGRLKPAVRVLLFQDGECVDSALPRLARQDVLRDLGEESLLNTGFRFNLVAGSEAESRSKRVRLFALTEEGTAGELHYPTKPEAWPFQLRPASSLDPVSRRVIERLKKRQKVSAPTQD